jgi:hypothetical protein
MVKKQILRMGKLNGDGVFCGGIVKSGLTARTLLYIAILLLLLSLSSSSSTSIMLLLMLQ